MEMYFGKSDFKAEQRLSMGSWGENHRVLVETMITSTDNPRIINYTLYKYPIEDPVCMSVDCFFTGEKLKIKSYFFPAHYTRIQQLKQSNKLSEQEINIIQMQSNFKGIIFYSHGWSDYAGR